MAVRSIVTYPAPILKRTCVAVERFDAELHELLDDMRDTMITADGLGLAANQVGVRERLFIMMIPGESEQTDELFEVINPEITARRGEQRFEEGCLSFPGIAEWVMRAGEIELRYRDRDGGEQVRTLSGLAAVCAQHELDHLDGITFIDRLSPLKRRLALRAYARERRAIHEDERDDTMSSLRG